MSKNEPESFIRKVRAVKKETNKVQWLWILKIALSTYLVTFIMLNFIVMNAIVPSGSMENTINVGDRIIADRVVYKVTGISRGDILVFHPPIKDKEHEYYIKRAIGLPGETIEGKDGYIYINKHKLDEPYIKTPLTEDFGPYSIPPGKYFMMGDNRTDSLDSRYWDIKYIDIDKITGRAVLKYTQDFQLFQKQEYNM